MSLLFFYASLPLIYAILGRLSIEPARRLMFLSLVLLNPVFLFWSNQFMIESTALFFGWMFAWAAWNAAQGPREGAWTAVTIAAGIVSGIVKVTTFALFLLPVAALFMLTARRSAEGRRATLVRGLLSLSLPLACSIAWTSYADALKRLNPLAADMVSSALRSWNFGTLSDRLSPAAWARVLDNTSVFPAFGAVSIHGVAFYWLLLFIAAGCLLFRHRAKEALLSFLLFLAGPLIFFNLYFQHDYYCYASIGFLSLSLGFLVLAVDERCQDTWTATPAHLRVIPALVLLICLLGVQYLQYEARYHSRLASHIPESYRTIIRTVQAHTRESDVLLIYNSDWSSRIPYLVQRRALMDKDTLPLHHPTMQQALANLQAQRARIGGMVVLGDMDSKAIEERKQRFHLAEYQDPEQRFEGVRLFFVADTAGSGKQPGARP